MKKGFYLSGLLALCFVFSSVVVKAAVPTVTLDPRDTAVCSGLVANFYSAATGTAPLSFQWQESTDGTTWASLSDTLYYSGTANDTLSITTDTVLSGRWYRVIVTNTSGADTSSAAMLTVNHLPYAGGITGTTDIVCKTFTIALSDTIAGGVWSSSTPSIATVDASGMVTGVNRGYDTIKYSYTNICGTDVASMVVRVDTVVSALPITGPTATCRGSFIMLNNVNVLGTGVWTVSNASASVSSAGMVTGLAYGLDTVTYTFTNGCNSVASTTTVQVDTVLPHGVITGPSGVCVGSWIHLNETVPGGIWMTAASGIANVDASGNVTGLSHGAAVISYFFSNACGASVATYTVNVTRSASVITGGDSVGVGATLALSDSATGTTDWSVANTAVATITSAGVVTGVMTGTTTVTFTVTNDCGTTSATMLLHVGLAPSAGSIAGPDSVCVGSNITMSDGVAGGVWMASNANASVSSSGVVTGAALGFDTLYYTVSNAFGSSTVSKKIYVNTTPHIDMFGPSLLALGGNYFIYGYPQGGTFTTQSSTTLGVVVSVFNGYYLFHKIDGSDSTTIPTTICSYVVLDTGTDVVTYHRTNTCGTSTSDFPLAYHLASGVNPVNANVAGAISIYPNPNNGNFTMGVISGVTESATITISNMVGEKVKEFTLPTNFMATDIKLDDQPAGMYIITATTTGGSKYTARVTVTK